MSEIPPVDADRFAEECRTNEDVLERLANDGDRSEVRRLIDVSFRGRQGDLERLARVAGDYGFSVQSFEADDDGEPWLFLVREQPADRDSIKQLTVSYLQIESIFGVECDGWGCLAQKE